MLLSSLHWVQDTEKEMRKYFILKNGYFVLYGIDERKLIVK
jgi:hypothetical protein